MNAVSEIRETHSGLVVLHGDLAYKTKKPVDLGFLDFRDADVRRSVLRSERELNRRLAPDVDLDLASFVRTDGIAAEPVLLMRRMRQPDG